MDLDKLRALPLLESIPAEHLEVLRKNLRPLSIEAGELLVKEGTTTRAPLFLLTDGQVEILRNDAAGVPHVLTFFEAPTVIGELEFLVDVPASASVKANDDLEGFVLPRERFEALFAEGAPVAYHLALSIGRTVSARLAETNQLLTKALERDPARMKAALSP